MNAPSFEEQRVYDTERVRRGEDEADDDEEEDDNEASQADGDETVSQPLAPDDDEDDGATAPTDAATGSGNNNSSDNQLVISAAPDLRSLDGLRELGPEAVCWQLSSAKPGNGVEQIRDPSLETYWQSDGQAQPHWIQVHFSRRVAISHVCLYLDYHLDESYTPKRIGVKAGMTHQDLQEAVAPVELPEPSGWCILPLRSPPDPLDDYDDDIHNNSSDDAPDGHANDDNLENSLLLGSSNTQRLYNHKHLVRAHLVRISILSMHQNGRDTHVRHVRLYGPRTNGSHALLEPVLLSNNNHRGVQKSQRTTDQSLDSAWNLGGMMMSSNVHSTRFTTIR